MVVIVGQPLKDEVQSLKTILEEAGELKRAIGEGDLDALVMPGPDGNLIFTLDSADHAYRVLVETMNEGTVTLGFDGTILYCNRRFAELLKMSSQAVVGRTIYQFIMSESVVKFNALLKHKMSTGEINLRAAGGKPLPVYISISSLQAEGSPNTWCLVVTDLTEQKKNEEIVAAERLARSIIEQAAETIVICDTSGRITHFSNSMPKLCGFDPRFQRFEEIINLRFSGGADAGKCVLPVSSALKGYTISGMEATFEPENSQKFHLLLNSGPLKGANGDIIGCVMTLTDITERKRLEIDLKRHEQHLNDILSSIQDGFFELDRDWRFTFINRRAAHNGNFEPEDLIGECIWERFPYMVNSKFEEVYRQVMETRLPANFDVKSLILDKWYEVSVYPSASGISAFWKDITDRKRAERALQQAYEEIHVQSEELQAQAEELREANEALSESEKRYRLIFDNSLDAIILTDPRGAGKVLSINPAACRMLGWSEEELIGKRRYPLLDPEDPTTSTFLDERARSGSAKVQITYRRKDGTTLFGELGSTLFTDSNGELRSVAIIRDVTERKRAEEALQKSEELFRTIIENSRDGINMLDLATGRYVFMSPAQVELTGYTAEEINNISAEEAYERVHPEDREVSVTQQKLLADGLDTTSDIEYRWKVKNGEYRWFSDRRKLVRDTHGHPLALVGVSRDITERKRAEEALRESEERMRHIAQIGRIGFVEWNAVKDTGYWTREHHEIFGYEPGSQMPWEQWIQGVHPDDRERVLANASQLLDSGRSEGQVRGHKDEYRFIRPDGNMVWIESDMSVDMVGGDPIIRGSVRDVTERKRAEQQLFNVNQRLKALMNALPVGVSLSDDSTCQTITGNPAFMAQFDIGPEDNVSASAPDNNVPGRKIRYFQDGQQLRDFELPLQRAVADNRKIPPMILDVEMANGRRWFAEASGAPIHDMQGKVVGGVAVTVDITERKKAERALKEAYDSLEEKVKERTIKLEEAYNSLSESERNLSEAQKMAHIGNWDLDIKTGEVYWSDETYRIFGLVPQEINLTCDMVLSYVHPSDRDYVINSIRKISNGKLKEIDYRIVLANGEERAINTRLEVIFDEKNNPARLRGTVQDITERNRAEKALEKVNKIRIKEIHHRIKNNLQVISSMLDLQAEKFRNNKVLEAFRESQNRVFSIALIHEELYKGDETDKLNFSVYIEKLAEKLFQTYSVSSKTHLKMDLEENAFMDMDTAVPLGILINELISNSLKHAFTEGEDGEIRIQLSRGDKEEKNNELHESVFNLTISDDGIGIPDDLELENVESLGLQLVVILVDQLDGEIELNRSQGTKFRITFNVKEK